MKYNQYQLVIVNLDPTVGSEIKKTRPCVIISPNEMNTNLNTIVIVPITSNLRDYPTRVKVQVNSTESRIVVDQIRTLDKQRIVKKIGQLSPKEIEVLKNVIYETYVQ
jgi:mRNA interferase MazF